MANKVCNIVLTSIRYEVYGTNAHVYNIAKILGRTWSPTTQEVKASVVICSNLNGVTELHKQVAKIRNAGYEINIMGEKTVL
jgi:hypothetical protein